MNYKELSSYRVIEEKRIDELGTDAVLMEHKKTKAKVVLFPNEEDNKVFYIGFRTPPTDSTGVAHIVEHSVLCGSAKYPVKDPFVELCKSSLNTFLNAMTFPDKTIYPVASCNDKDFSNLMDIYLDAVFYPNMHRNEKIFRQEGWHYEMESAESDLTLNGVVYSEMKGVYSSSEDIVREKIMEALYPDSIYGVESGGHPDVIPKLSYEDFLDFHSRYYHPSNSYIFLYGNMDMAEKLDYMDREYLSKFDYLELDSSIGMQKPFAPKDIVCEYPITEEEDLEENTYLSFNTIFDCDNSDRELYLALGVVENVLCSYPGAPLKQALIEKGIGSDISATFENGILQPYCSIMAYNAESSQKDEFVKTIEDTLRKVIKEGLDKKTLLACIINAEFSYREADFGSLPKGLVYGIQILDSWLYDSTAPFIHVECGDVFKSLKEKVNTDYFEKIIEKYILNNESRVVLTAVPKKGLAAEREKKLADELASYKNSLSEEEIEKIVLKTRELKEYQESEDSPENLAKIPKLTREDIGKKAKIINSIEDSIDGSTFVKQDLFTNGIGYVRIFFNMDDVPYDLYKYIRIFEYCFLKMNTKNFTYQDMYSEMKLYTGGMSFSSVAFLTGDEKKEQKCIFKIGTRFLYENMEDAFRLIKEVAFNTLYDDADRLKELLNEMYSRQKSFVSDNGHTIALNECVSCFDTSYALDKSVGGVKGLRFLQELTENFDERKDEVLSKLEELRKCIFRPENIMLNYISPLDEERNIRELFLDLKQNCFTCDVRKEKLYTELNKSGKAYKTSGQVQYVAFGGMYSDKYKYSGKMAALKMLLSYDYLWTNIRVKGGAYGCFFSMGRNNSFVFLSYRDPNLAGTLETFKKTAEYLKNVSVDETTLTGYIIGAIGELDTPRSPAMEGDRAMGDYLKRIPTSDTQKFRDELLSVTEEDIHDFAGCIEEIIKNGNLCVVGSESAINTNKELFTSIESIF